MDFEDDGLEIRPSKLGKDKKAARQGRRFVSVVARAVQRAGGRSLGAGPRLATRSPLARGRGNQLRRLASNQRQVVVKTRIVRHAGARYRAAPLARHIRYLEREGVTRDGARAHMFDARIENADVADFTSRCEDDRHHFRFIVSPEDAVDLADLRAFTRDLMRQAQADLGTRLDWVAVDHWNTDNPHVHILVRGRTDDGADLVIDSAYLTRGLRERAKALASLELGPRSEQQIQAALRHEVSAERWTALDAALRDIADQDAGMVDLRPGDPRLETGFRTALVGRAMTLERLGLAQPQGVDCWTLSADLQPTLRALSIRGDIIKTLHQAMSREGGSADPARFALQPDIPSDTILGRLVDRGLHDELSGSAYAVIDGVDGRSHHVRFGDLEATSDAPIGGMVELRTWTDRQDRTRTSLAVRSDLSIEAQVTAPGATWLDRQLVSKAPVPLADGFGETVREALDLRRQHLIAQGLARESFGRVVLERGLLDALRRRELGDVSAALSADTSLRHAPAAEGDNVSGVYRRRLDLSSGRYAMIDDGLGFQLVPWRPALDAKLGQHVSGVMGGKGQVDWSWDKTRGLGL